MKLNNSVSKLANVSQNKIANFQHISKSQPKFKYQILFNNLQANNAGRLFHFFN